MVRTEIRASAIIVKGKEILLIHRKNMGEEYWVFPGGGVEESETPEEAVAREVGEETSLEVSNVKFAFEVETYEGGNLHPFYFANVSDGELVLGGPEKDRNPQEDWYNPEWVGTGSVHQINLVPESAKQKLLELVSQK